MKVRWIVGVLGVFGLSLGLAGKLYGHGGDPDLIHTCVNNSSGAVDFIAPNGTCHSNEHPVDWDKAARTAVMTFTVDCDAGDKIGLPPTIGGMTIDLIPGDTLNVTGTCNENVTIREEIDRITLDGQGMATIAAPVSTQNAIQVRGRGITIIGFTISGGSSGINVARGGTATIDSNVVQNTAQSGINVTNSGFATIVNNTIQNNPLHGIQLSSGGSAFIGFRSGDPVASPNIIQNNGNIGINFSESSSARIDGNTIADNGSFGINVGESSSARIGFSGPVGSFTAANTIQNNGRDGIRVFGSSYAGIEGNLIQNNTGTGRGVIVDTSSTVEIGVRGFSNTIQNNAGGGIGLSRSSSARILAAVISNNTGNGVQISRASQADVGNNTINANTLDGILVEENSGLNLNLVPAAPANSGSNGGFGIRCRIGGYANGSIGSLTGASGQKSFGATTFTLTTVDGASSNWGPVLDGDGTTLTVTGANGTVTINNEGCIDRTTP